MLVNATEKKWFSSPKRNSQAQLKLFCFPYAGGNSQTYRGWPFKLPETIEVQAVNLPGRGTRLREAPFTRLTPLVHELAEAILPELDKPFAFFGHSMGALIAFELTHQLRKLNLPSPAHLIVSGRSAPHLPDTDPQTHDLPEKEFLEELRRLNGTPAEALDHPELMQLMLPILRADFAICETYSYEDRPVLDCPITALGGLDDANVSREELASWRERTSGAFTMRMFPGDHFYLHTSQSPLLETVTALLTK
ncbi:MAG TPA: thioesterase II family protein [Pyrinomonadaceae bacterium]|jgi:medium-chain acyl-[acyl-carrier-protein] hydrolase|nr:thioesterase II family protein [Pyrinomonadaceae bacterium]